MKEHFEQHSTHEVLVPDYEGYTERGGKIDRTNYEQALAALADSPVASHTEKLQAEGIARAAGVVLHGNTEENLVVRLYGILRTAKKPDGIEHHHSQMSDQQLLAEALHMAGDSNYLKESYEKLKNTHQHIDL